MEVPSSEWSPAERLEVIKQVASRLDEAVRKSNLDRNQVFDLTVTINHVASMSPGFLEANRATILKDAGISNESLEDRHMMP